MKLLPENIKVLYFASDCVEPYVEVGLLYVIVLGEIMYCMYGVWVKYISLWVYQNVFKSSIHPSFLANLSLSNPVMNSLVMLLC